MSTKTVKKRSKTSSAVKNKYNSKVYDRIEIVVPKGQKEVIKLSATENGESVNNYIVTAINTRMSTINRSDNDTLSSHLNAIDTFITKINTSDEMVPETFERVNFNRELNI